MVKLISDEFNSEPGGGRTSMTSTHVGKESPINKCCLAVTAAKAEGNIPVRAKKRSRGAV